MESLSPEEENIRKDIRNLLRLNKEQNDIAVKGIINLFRLKKEIKGIKDIILRNIKLCATKLLTIQWQQEKSFFNLVLSGPGLLSILSC